MDRTQVQVDVWPALIPTAWNALALLAPYASLDTILQDLLVQHVQATARPATAQLATIAFLHILFPTMFAHYSVQASAWLSIVLELPLPAILDAIPVRLLEIVRS